VTFKGSTAALVIAGAALAGCGGSSSGGDTGTSAKAAPPAPKGEIHFVAPADGAKTGSTIHAKVALKNFQINARTVGQAPRPGQGHLHFKMDEGKFDYPKYSGKNGFLAKKLGVTGTYSPALAPSITYSHLPPGKHELEVYLANNNHTNVGVEAKVEFTVK
jgi:hypothetical protein